MGCGNWIPKQSRIHRIVVKNTKLKQMKFKISAAVAGPGKGFVGCV
jgi:hypothetical protein